MIVAKIREIENKKEEARKEYIDTCAFWDKQIEYLQNAISNRGCVQMRNIGVLRTTGKTGLRGNKHESNINRVAYQNSK